MVQLCRHIKTDSTYCGSPAIKGTLFCYNHAKFRTAVAKAEPKPDPYGIYTPLGFVFPEDHAAIQLNLFLVAQALNDKSLDNRTANTFNRLFRSCELNLQKWQASKAERGDTVQHVVLTPNGEEIAPLREVLEEGESEPVHGPTCPCLVCAEEFRGVAPEEHHEDCKCGFCQEVDDEETASDPASAIDAGDPASAIGAEVTPTVSIQGCRADRSTKCEVEEPIFFQASQESDLTENDSLPATPSLGSAALGRALPRRRKARRVAPAWSQPVAHVKKSPSINEYFFGDQISQYEAEQAEIARAAREAGQDPPPHKPWNNTMYRSKAERRYEEHQQQIKKNQQAARQAWTARYPDIPPEEPAQSWGEEQDRKLAEMREAAVTQQATAVS